MVERIPALRISSFTACSAAGANTRELLAALRDRRSGLSPNNFTGQSLLTWIGRVRGVEESPLPAVMASWESRNNRLAWMGISGDGFYGAVTAARHRYGKDRIALVLGTSTSSMGATEEGYRTLQPDGMFPPHLRAEILHEPHALGDFVQHALELTGISLTVATACSSSAKVFAIAERLLRAGLADAAVVGGVDSLCGSVLFGFNSLELLSPEPCRPFDPARRGLSLGEAAGFALLERDAPSGPWLVGYGESSDAHHMSAPHPEGLGARVAIQDALHRAGLDPEAIDYINMHGTATQKNDETEARVVADLFPFNTRASSTKGWTGHTLGAAGIVEAVVTLLAIKSGLVPGTLNSSSIDPAFGPQLSLDNEQTDVRFAMSQSFGFGGSNCVLIFGRERPR